MLTSFQMPQRAGGLCPQMGPDLTSWLLRQTFSTDINPNKCGLCHNIPSPLTTLIETKILYLKPLSRPNYGRVRFDEKKSSKFFSQPISVGYSLGQRVRIMFHSLFVCRYVCCYLLILLQFCQSRGGIISNLCRSSPQGPLTL